MGRRWWAPDIVGLVVEESELERELQEVGRRLWKGLPSSARRPLKALDDKAMDLASRDAELKAALFRFVDVVPACRNLDDLATHLTGFLREVEEPAPPIAVATPVRSSLETAILIVPKDLSSPRLVVP